MRARLESDSASAHTTGQVQDETGRNPGQHQCSVGVQDIRDVPDEPRLALSQKPGDQHDGGRSGHRLLPFLDDGLDVVVASNERESAVQDDGARDGRHHGVVADADDAYDIDRLFEALQCQRPEVLEAGIDPALGEAMDKIGGEDLAGRSDGFEPCCLDHRDTVDVAILGGDLAGAQPDPDLEGGHGIRAAAVSRHRSLHVDGRGDSGRGDRGIGL